MDLLESLLRAVHADASVQPVVRVFLAHAMAQGIAQFKSACAHALSLGTALWDVPRHRSQLLASVLEAEVSALAPEHFCFRQKSGQFEELLSLFEDSDPAKVDWW